MTCSLPQEILDLIIDHLHDEPNALKSCSIVTKAWLYRTRTHLFNHVKFSPASRHVSQWKETFPDPTNSPAHYTRTLSINYPKLITPADVDTLLAFCGVSHLHVDTGVWYDQRFSVVQLHGFSPTVKSLHLSFTHLLSSEIFGLVCSFPLLKDLSLTCTSHRKRDGAWTSPSTSPRLTGSLELSMDGGIQSTTRQLLGLPNGLHFKNIAVRWVKLEDVGSTMDLVSSCSDTLKCLDVANCLIGMFSWRVYLFLTQIRIEGPETASLDLSEATKLERVAFLCKDPNVQWIVTTLLTAGTKNLQSVSITLSHRVILRALTVESIHQGWLDLDRLLVQFWTSHSLRLKLMYEWIETGKDLNEAVGLVLPELTRRGIVDVVK